MSSVSNETILKEPPDLVKVSHLKKYYPVRTGILQRVSDQVLAVDDVSFSVKKGETLGMANGMRRRAALCLISRRPW